MGTPSPPLVNSRYASRLESPQTAETMLAVVTNDPHNGDPTAIFEDEMPVHVGGVWETPASIISTVCGDINPDAYLLFIKGGDGVPIACILLQVTMCPCSQGRASSFAGDLIAQL